MKKTVLARVPNGDTFTFGGVQFTRDEEKTDPKTGLIQCTILNLRNCLYISELAVVEIEE